jgi:16S rRNA (guanine966-N2)-methyltransferase
MRERVFAIVAGRVAGARVLDLFAGTGAVGIEALSRGAAEAVFIDVHRSAVSLIRDNLAGLEVGAPEAVVLQRSTRRAVGELARTGRVFDLVWADPPFEDWESGLEAIVAAVESGLAAPGAILCLECPAAADVEHRIPGSLEIERDLAGGASRVVLMRLRPQEQHHRGTAAERHRTSRRRNRG